MPPTKSKKAKLTERMPATNASSMWARHGLEDVYFQREAQVNFWTVMGGVAAAALLTQASGLWEQMQAGRWHLGLFFINSILSIGLSWAMLSWGSLVLKYPIAIPSILLLFLSTFAVAVQSLLVTNPAGWLAAAAFATFANWLHQIFFQKIGAWEPFSPATIKQLKANLRIYGLWPLIAMAGAVQLYLAPSMIAETVWGLIVLAVTIDAMFRQHRGMQREKEELGIP